MDYVDNTKDLKKYKTKLYGLRQLETGQWQAKFQPLGITIGWEDISDSDAIQWQCILEEETFMKDMEKLERQQEIERRTKLCSEILNSAMKQAPKNDDELKSYLFTDDIKIRKYADGTYTWEENGETDIIPEYLLHLKIEDITLDDPDWYKVTKNYPNITPSLFLRIVNGKTYQLCINNGDFVESKNISRKLADAIVKEFK